MRIIYWTESFLPDISGVSILGQNILPELQKRGFEFIIVTSNTRQSATLQDELNGIPIYRFNFHKYLINKDLQKINKTINELNHINKKFKPDIAHINSSEPSLFYYAHSRMKCIPTILTVHLFIKEIHNKNALFKRSLKEVDWITTVSSNTLEHLQKILPEIISRSSHLKNSIQTPIIQQVDITHFKNNLLFLGRLAPEKGVNILLKSFSIINRNIRHLKLIIAGDGPESDYLKDLTLKLGLGDFVSFIGEVNPQEIPALINSVYLVIAPSTQDEQSSMVALQAGIMGRPIIGTKVNGLKELIQNKVTGLLANKDDPEDLADKIMYLIENPEIALKYGMLAKERVENEYNFNTCINEYASLYKKVSGKSN